MTTTFPAGTGLSDELFVRGNVPMTKAEIRAITLAQAEICDGYYLLDIGAGTGSITVEAARLTPRGKVTAIERDPAALELIRTNCQRFDINNVEVIEGEAPAAIACRKHYDVAIVGGSGGKLHEIINAAPNFLKPGGRIVLNAITLENIATINSCLHTAPWTNLTIKQVQIARGIAAGKSLTRFEPLSPVWIASANLASPADNTESDYDRTKTLAEIDEIDECKIFGVGVGPGDPDLITRKAISVLQMADIIALPAAGRNTNSTNSTNSVRTSSSAPELGLAYRIAKPYLRRGTIVVELDLPMTEDRLLLQKSWENAAQQLIDLANNNQRVAFLTLGDPMFYSTWIYIFEKIREKAALLPIKTIPGVTSLSACAARLGLPIAHGRTPLIVWPAEPNKQLLGKVAEMANLVFMKAGRHVAAISALARELINSNNGSSKAGNNSAKISCAGVRRCGLPNEEFTSNIEDWEQDSDYFTTIFVRREEP